MRLWQVSIVLILLFPLRQSFGQLPNVLNKICFDGNKNTKSGYLLNHIQTKTGRIPDSAMIDQDLRRLKTLSSILDAKYTIFHSDSGLVLLFHLEERWTLLPVGDFGISEGNYWVGAGAMQSNALGRGIYAYGYIQYRTPFVFHAIVRNPYLFGSKWGGEFQGKVFEIEEPMLAYSYDLFMQSEYQVLAKYEFVYEKDVLAGLAYSDEQVEFMGQTLDHRKSIRLLSEIRLQMLDYHIFILDGWKLNASMSYRLPFTNHKNTYMAFAELLYFKSFAGRYNLASRLGIGISSEQQHQYYPYIIDNYRNIRGSGYRTFRGNRIGIANMELRTTLFENSWSGIQFVAFTDIGFVSSKVNKATSMDQGSLIYAGPGFRFIYKKAYNAVLSIDYGFNLSDIHNGGWVLGWGQYF